MATRTRIDVTPDDKSGGWLTKRGSRATRYDTKQAALSAAVEQARRSGNAQVVIRKKDGTIQSERTYGGDPRRTRG